MASSARRSLSTAPSAPSPGASSRSPVADDVRMHPTQEYLNGEEMSKSVYEEDEVASLSGSDGASNALGDDGIVGYGPGDANGPTLCTEDLPLVLNLKSGDFEFRDQITWSVSLPLDLNGCECQDYVAYNLQNPMIDLFALRTVEEMDFPVGFDISVARSIRAQLMTLIPIVWRERQAIAIQERRASSARRTKKLTRSDLGEEKISTALQGSASPGVREEVAQLITGHTAYPIQAVRRLLNSTVGEEGRMNEEADRVDLDEVEVDAFKKRKRSVDEDTTHGRKKRKRGTAFEAHVLHDERIPIRINLAISGVLFQDRFDWDPSAPLFWTDIFARRTAAEVGLTREFELAIAHDIKRQVLAYLAHTSHQLPPEWNSAQTTNSAPTSAQETSANSSEPQNSTNNAKGESNKLATSSSSVTRTNALDEARNNAPNVPTSSLPILSLHNVIRPPQSCHTYSPSLSIHPPSKQRWDRLQAKKKAVHNKPHSTALASPSTGSSTHPSASSSGVSSNPTVPAPGNTAKAPFSPMLQRPAPSR